MAAPADYQQWLRYKEDFNIEVDEASPQFAQWMKVFLLMMRPELHEVNFLAHAPQPQHWDCCVVCSDSDHDLAVAEEFRKNLENGGYYACVLQDVPPGGRLLDAAEAMLSGSTVVFVLCTPDLVRDRGLARVAYQDCLAIHLSNAAKSSKIVPVVVPTSVPSTQCQSLTGTPRARGDSLVSTAPNRIFPLGAILFRPIRLTEPKAYMKQVSKCISVREQRQVRDTRQLQAETWRLLREKHLRQSQERAVKKALELFQSAPSASSLLKVESCLSSITQRPHHLTDLAGLDDDTRRLLDDLGTPTSPQQTVALHNCSEVSIGTSFQFHITDSTSF